MTTKQTTRGHRTMIKGRGVTIAVDDREIERDRRRALKLKAANARYSAVFDLFDTIETAQHRVKGAMGVMAALLDTNGEIDDAAALTMERHMQRDMAELDAAVSAARAAILDPLAAAAKGKAT